MGRPMLAVFVPGLMGAGILLSAGILVTDGIRRLLPNRGARRKVVQASAVHTVVERAAVAAGIPIPEHRIERRRPRSRWLYLIVGVVFVLSGILAIRLGLNTYADPRATLHENPWSIVLGDVSGALLFVGAAVAIVLAGLGHRPPRLIARLISATPVGRLAPPPDDPVARAHELNPWLDGREVP